MSKKEGCAGGETLERKDCRSRCLNPVFVITKGCEHELR